MKRWLDVFQQEKTQFIIYAVIFAAILIFTIILWSIERDIFVSHLGKVNPLISISILSLFGLVSLLLLVNRGWFAVFRGWDSKGYWTAAGLSAIFFLEVIVLDLVFRYPRGINILFPKSLLYYPVVGFVVNVLFHVVMVSILIFLTRLLFPQADLKTIIWTAIVLAALVEPIYQMAAGAAVDGWTWLVALTGVHVLLINLAQLYLFKRYDFVTMYAMRLMYYLLWHIAWGMLRLTILF